ncbi:glutathione S-transferase domain-containing protein DDB_G0274223-like [Amyelois transitella]|uniref:glutathione S-transferase domain-containing protein DDB_G0274223-like n=1 Tax=Amyelois transitella TaxID=680683 RepID=UPI0029902AF6|nr:glutathione S-transferase domain-containing protein DDB_G0274223-like [Amyelois transitella]
MTIDMYYTTGSPPCILVSMVASALDVPLNLKLVDVIAGEQYNPEFLKLNPQHVVPTIVDGDLVMWESRAISRYLVNRYGKGSSLYPEDPKTRARVDQLLDFDVGVLYLRFADYFYPPILYGAKTDPALLKKLQEALQLFNVLLEGRKFAAASDLTLADLALVATVSTIEISDIDLNPYPNIQRWYKLVKSTAKDYEEINGNGVKIFKEIFDNLKAKINFKPVSLTADSEMPIDLYYTDGSAPCRLVLLVAAALDVHLNLMPVDLRAGEQFTPEFLKLNPQHTVPTIVDGEFSLWESRAISRYLVNQYGKGSSLYPEDPKARALVDQRLDFDLGVLYPRFANYFYPTLFGGTKADEAQHKKLEEALVFLNTFLADQTYAAGPQLTLADLSLVATVSTIDVAGISLEQYPNVVKWYDLVKSTAKNYEKANGKGVKIFKNLVDQLKAKTEL